jgi:hypothetical protein
MQEMLEELLIKKRTSNKLYKIKKFQLKNSNKMMMIKSKVGETLINLEFPIKKKNNLKITKIGKTNRKKSIIINT